MLSFEKTYYDTQFSRPYIIYADDIYLPEYFEKVRQIWKGRDVILIEGVQSRVGIGNDLLNTAASVRRILGPAKNAFERYADLLREAILHPKEVLFLLALGPTATVLACDLAKIGYRALDIGHIDLEYEWFLRKATKKTRIPGKYVNEVRGGHRVDEGVVNSEYRKQVIATIR